MNFFVLRITGFSNRKDVPHVERHENLRLRFDGDVEEQTVLRVNLQNKSFRRRRNRPCHCAIFGEKQWEILLQQRQSRPDFRPRDNEFQLGNRRVCGDSAQKPGAKPRARRPPCPRTSRTASSIVVISSSPISNSAGRPGRSWLMIKLAAYASTEALRRPASSRSRSSASAGRSIVNVAMSSPHAMIAPSS